jgi:cytochrome c556
MREVGDRFQTMYVAAKDGNWALAAYMSKYMNGAMNPAKLTKPEEYATWKNFYEGRFAAVEKTIQAKDLAGFEAAYTKVIDDCNSCHKKMDYGFIKVVKMKVPADVGIDYTVKSQPGDVPK